MISVYTMYMNVQYIKSYLHTRIANKNMMIEAGRGAAARGVTANRLVVGSIPTRGDEIFT